MNPLPLHPMIVHMPLALAMIAPMVLGGAVLLLLRKRVSQRAWWLAVALQALVVVTGIAALRTGEADEERVEAVVNEAAIEAHEESAQTFVIAAAVVFGVALAGALLPRRVLPWLGGAATAGSLAVAALAIAVGHAGGELVYRHGAAVAFAAPGASASPAPGPASEGGGAADDD